MEKFEKTIIGGNELWRCTGFVEHRRSNNWVARITGTSEKYKFNREFLKITKIDKVPYVELEEGGLYQFAFTYYTGGGRACTSNAGFFTIEGGEFVFLTEAQVLEKLDARNQERENPLSKFSDEEILAEARRRGLLDIPQVDGREQN